MLQKIRRTTTLSIIARVIGFKVMLAMLYKSNTSANGA